MLLYYTKKHMDHLKQIAEVRNDHRDSFTGKYCIDVYLTDDDNEQGFVIAEVDADGNVEWKRLSRLDGYDMTPVHEAVEEAKQEQIKIKKELVEKCVEAIVNDVKGGDLMAIDELLFHVPVQNLQVFLPEE